MDKKVQHKKRPGVMLYFNFRPGLRRLSVEEKGLLFDAILDYGESGMQPEFDGVLGVVWDFIEPMIDADAEAYSQKCEKASQAVKTRWARSKENTDAYDRIPENTNVSSRIRNIPNTNTNTNTNAIQIQNNTNTKDNIEPPAESPAHAEYIISIISYLNEKAGTKYKPTTPKTRSLINARLAEGFEVDDFKRVIDNKCADWLNDTTYEKYLRPETLFGTKFEGYLNTRAKQTAANAYDDLDDIF